MSSLIKYSFLALASFAAAAPAIDSRKDQAISAIIGQSFSDGERLTPQIINTLLEPNKVNIARNSYVYRDGTMLRLRGDPWTASGANVYWLGLDENVIPPSGEPFYAPLNASYPTKGRITETMNILVTMGAKLIRSQTLGVSVGNPLSLEPALDVFNAQAFDTIDWSIFQARQHGLRIVVPLTDNYDYYHGGKFTFLRWAGYNISGSDNPLPPETQAFYTDQKVIAIFKNYIQHLLTHVNPYTGLTYAEDPTIIAYETGNELGGTRFGDKDVPNSWTREICQLIKSLGPRLLCVDGTYGINATHFEVTEVDIYSDHFYPINNTKLNDDIAQVESTNRVYIAGEIEWTGTNGLNRPDPQGDPLASFFDIIEQRQNTSKPVAAGSLFWSLFGRNVPDCNNFVNHSDGFTLQYGNPLNLPRVDTQISIIRQHFFAMQNITVDDYLPAVACPHNFIPGYDAQYTYA